MKTFRVVGAAAAFAVGMIISMGGCATPGGSPGPLPEPDARMDLGSPGAQTATYESVTFYPACGNETLAHEGEKWFPFTPENPEDFPTPASVANDAGAAGEALSKGATASAPGRVSASLGTAIAPGPGDDVGTLTVYEDGFAHWVSDSGDLDTWLTDTELTYNWVC